jgi:hypothetical protein
MFRRAFQFMLAESHHSFRLLDPELFEYPERCRLRLEAGSRHAGCDSFASRRFHYLVNRFQLDEKAGQTTRSSEQTWNAAWQQSDSKQSQTLRLPQDFYFGRPILLGLEMLDAKVSIKWKCPACERSFVDDEPLRLHFRVKLHIEGHAVMEDLI